MTVPTSDNREQYLGNDSATEFDYAFKIFRADDLVVVLTESDGTETTLTRGTDYSVDGVGNENGGRVIYPLSGDPLATGETLTILREIPVVQETDLRNQGAYYPETLEDEFDRSRMIDQQIAEAVSRSVRAPAGNSPLTPLPGVSDRIKKFLSFDEAGNPTAVVPREDTIDEVSRQLALEYLQSYVDSAESEANRAENEAESAAGDAVFATQEADRAEIAADSVKPYVDGALSDLSTAANKFYPTLALANADIANIMVNQPIHVGEEANGGLWYKATSGATTLTKSAYDPVYVSKTYADKVSNTAFDIKYTIPSKNLFNPKDALIGYVLLGSTGKEAANPDYISTGKIPVEAGVKYRVTGSFSSMFVYDANDSLLSRHNKGTPIFEDSVATMPPAAAYVRFTITAVGATSEALDDNDLSISKGAEPIAYRKGYPTIDGLKLNDSHISYINKEVVLDTRKEINLTSENIIDFKGNLFHANKSAIGKSITSDGSSVENPGWYHSDFIQVNPNDVYTLSGRVGSYAFEHIAYYDKDKKFITRNVARTVVTTNGRVEVTTPPDAYYAILNMQVSYPTEDERMFYKGSGAKAYERPALSEDMSKAVFDNLSTDYLKPSINLISHDLIEDNFTLVSSSGVKVPNTGYGMVEFIPVEPNTLYTARGGRLNSIFYYDSSKTFISRTTSLGEITTPSNAYFARFIITKPVGGSLDKGQFFAKGRFEEDYYTSGNKQITNLKLDDENIEDIGKRLRVTGSPFFLSHSPTSIYDNKASFDGYLDWKTKTPEQVYAMFDALVAAHPTYITKQPLGVTQEGREMSAYRVTPVRPNASAAKRRYPKVLVVGSIHGAEKLPALTLYLMLEQMCNNHTSDDMLALLRFNVEFVILPLANPDGWVRNQRKNASEIDLNRNFPSGFAPPTVEPSDPKYGGLTPLSEIESQLINDLIQSNLDADIGIDFHNFFTSTGTPIWVNSLSSSKTEMLTQALVVRMTEKWRKEYAWIPTDADYFAGYSTIAPGNAILARHMQDSGIPTCVTYEFSENWGTTAVGVVSYDATFLSTAIEAYINLLVMMLDAADKNKIG